MLCTKAGNNEGVIREFEVVVFVFLVSAMEQFLQDKVFGNHILIQSVDN